MNRDKDEFWAITDPDGRLLPGTYLTRAEALAVVCAAKFRRRVFTILNVRHYWKHLYREGYRARRVRVEVI